MHSKVTGISKISVAVFASGSGTNAENLFKTFQDHPFIEMALLVCNREGAGVIERAKNWDVPVAMADKQTWREPYILLETLEKYGIDLIVLAGFLWLIPAALVEAYPERIINIHPALLPKYGGKGMYGSHVHQAVINARDLESGITIHYVDEHYDKGDIIIQKKINIDPSTTSPEELAARIHELEYQWFPVAVEEVASRLLHERAAR